MLSPPEPLHLLLFTPRNSQSRTCGALRRFAATFAHKPALPSSAQAGKVACKHALFLPVADE